MEALITATEQQEAPYVPDVHDHEAEISKEYGWDTYRFVSEEPDYEPPFTYHPLA